MIPSKINIELFLTLLENLKIALEKAVIKCITLYVAYMYTSVLLIRDVISVFSGRVKILLLCELGDKGEGTTDVHLQWITLRM